MAVDNTSASSGPYYANGVTTVFPFSFCAAGTAEVRVLVNDEVLDPARYVVALDDTGAGNVTISPALVSGTVYVESNPDFTQTTSFQRSGPYFPDFVNKPLDRSAVRDIYLLDRIKRAFVAPRGTDIISYIRALIGPGPAGAPGINGGVGSSAGDAALFAAANGMAVGAGITAVTTSGWSAAGVGGANYVYDAAVTTANGLTTFLAADGRGFKLDPNQRLTPHMFGAGAARTGAQNFNAIKAALEYKPTAGSVFTPHQVLGPGVFHISATIEPEAVFTLKGQGTSYDNGGASGRGATIVTAPTDTTAVRIKVGSTGDVLTPGSTNAAGSTVEGLYITQATIGTNRDAHGIHARGTITARDTIVRGVAGDGINISADSGGTAATYGNANNWFLGGIQIDAEGHGLCVGKYKGVGAGADTNAGLSIALNVHRAGKTCVYDQSYYANTYLAPQFNASGNNGVHYNGATWQLIVETSLNTAPGSNGDWYKLRTQAMPDVNFQTWNAGTIYYATGPILATNPAVVITPYQENQRTLGHVPAGIVIGGNMGVTQLTPRLGTFVGQGLTCNMGVGHYRTPAGDPNHPAYAFIGDAEYTFIGAPGDDGSEIHKRATIFKHQVADGRWEIRYKNVVGGVERDIFSDYAGRTQWSISGRGTARTYGRTATVEGMYSLHDHAIVDATDGNNARIHGIRAVSPSGSYCAQGEFYWNVNPSKNGGILGWATTGSGTPGEQTPVRIFGQMPAQADLPADATLPTMVAAHNALLAKLRAAGFLAA